MVIALLSEYSIQTDSAAFEVRQTGIPSCLAVALATIRRLDHVETKEAKRIAIFHHGNRSHRLIPEQSDQETIRVSGAEAIRVVPSGVPSFCRRPVDSDIHFLAESSLRIL